MPSAPTSERYIPYGADNNSMALAAAPATSHREESFWRKALRHLFSRRRPRDADDEEGESGKDDGDMAFVDGITIKSSTTVNERCEERGPKDRTVSSLHSPDPLRGRCLRDFRFATEQHSDGLYFSSRCRDVTNVEHRSFRTGDVLHIHVEPTAEVVLSSGAVGELSSGDVVVVGSRCGEVWVAEIEEVSDDNDDAGEADSGGVTEVRALTWKFAPLPAARPLSSVVRSVPKGTWVVKRCARVPLHESAGCMPVQGNEGEDPGVVRFLRVAPDLAVRRVTEVPPTTSAAASSAPPGEKAAASGGTLTSREVVLLSPVAMRVGTSWVCGWSGAEEVTGSTESTPEGTWIWSASIGLSPV